MIGRSRPLEEAMLGHEVADWPIPPSASKAVIAATPAAATGAARSWFKASTNVLHFGGFEVGQEYQLTVDVVNTMHESKRMQVLPPTTSNFKISFEKKGHIAPGLAQTIRVTFRPTEFRYYYDCIRVQDEAGILPIAIHGYPTANTVEVPDRVDFGTCALTETHRKTFLISCSIPMPFGFRVEITKNHPHMKLSPMSGTIPANDNVTIVVEYTPLALGTAIMEVNLFVEQFAFEPKRITICGNSASGIVRQRLIQDFSEAIQQLNTTREQEEAENGLQANDKHVLGSPHRPRGIGSGATIDGGANWIREKHAHTSKKKLMQTEKHAARSKSFTEKWKAILATQTKGLDVPAHFNTQAGVNSMLTQVTGKFQTKDLKAATRAATEQQNALSKSTTFAPPPRALDLEQILLEESMETRQQPRQLREMTFFQQCNNIRDYEKSKLLRANEEFIGSKLLSADDIEAIQQNRKQLAQDEKEARWETDKRRTQTLYKGVDESDDLCARPTTYVSNVRLEDIVAGSATQGAADIQASLTFDPNTNDEWRKRMTTQRRFIAAVSKVIVQRRASLRLSKIQAWLGDCRDKQTIRNRVQEENRNAVVGGATAATSHVAKPTQNNEMLESQIIDTSRPISAVELSTATPAFRLQEQKRAEAALARPVELSPEMFRPSALPRYVAAEESMQPPRQFNMELTTFDDRTVLPLAEQSHVEAMGYEQQSYVTTPFYFPFDPAREMLEGGFEESCLQELEDESLEELLELLDDDLPDANAEQGNFKFHLKYHLSQNLQTGIEHASIPTALLSGERNLTPEERFLNCTTPYYLPPMDAKETDPDWRIKTTPLVWQEELTVAKARLAKPGYLAVASYINMPTISDIFLPDTDRHASGLYCYANDHLRLPHERDPDLPEVKRGMVDKEDLLTDSESDDEDAYPVVRPSLAKNRTLWQANAESTEDEKNTDSTATFEASLQAMRDQALSMDKRTEVVELPRQKAMVEQAMALTEQRKKQFSILPDRLAAISRSAPALHLAIPVQMPFHTVEDRLFEQMKAEKEAKHVELEEKSPK